MMAIYSKSVRELLKEFVVVKNLKPADIVTRQDVINWFNENYPKIKKGTLSAHLIRMSTNAPSRIHYSVHANGDDDLFYQIDSSHFRLYNKENDPFPIYEPGAVTMPPQSNEDLTIEEVIEAEAKEFAYERDLRNYLSKNLFEIEPGLNLYEEEGIKGIEFPVGGRFIDILAQDKGNNFVVIELKVSRGYDRVVGQLLRYIAWIEKNLAEVNQKVRGIIIASNISEDLLLAASKVPDIQLYEYDLKVSLRKKNR
jgi:endonuclease